MSDPKIQTDWVSSPSEPVPNLGISRMGRSSWSGFRWLATSPIAWILFSGLFGLLDYWSESTIQCAWCKRIRVRKARWLPLEDYLSQQSEVSLSHGICPACRMDFEKEQ